MKKAGQSDTDFKDTGLKVSSVVRVGRLAVVEDLILIGAIGEIQQARLQESKQALMVALRLRTCLDPKSSLGRLNASKRLLKKDLIPN